MEEDLENPSANVFALPDASRAEHLPDEIAAKSAPHRAVAGGSNGASVGPYILEGERERRPVGENGSVLDEHLVGEIAVGDHDSGEGEELDRHNGSEHRSEVPQKELEAVQSSRKPK